VQHFVRLVGPNQAVELFGIRLVGVNAENGLKLLVTIVFVIVTLTLARGIRWGASRWIGGRGNERLEFWTRQGVHLGSAAVLFLGIASIWFDDPTRLTTALGLISAGLAFALQKVVTALAGYFIILRGQTFNVGDRIRMGGVRGDVIALGFTQTTIMEMGQPPSVQGDEPAVWVRSRQYTGRVVTVSNAKIFDEPVYNYSSEFPYVWEEMNLPISYSADRARAERILLDIAQKHTVKLTELSEDALQEMERRYFLTPAPTAPKVYFRLTDNWLELAVRFIAEVRGVRDLKDQMSRDLLEALDVAGIGIASATFEITQLPKIQLQLTDTDGKPAELK
jgi:small-conductance mechanosensitive channel